MFPNANKEFITKNISSLRAYFGRQIRGINSAKRSGVEKQDVPTRKCIAVLYDFLFFILDQKESRSAMSSLDETELDDESQSLVNIYFYLI